MNRGKLKWIFGVLNFSFVTTSGSPGITNAQSVTEAVDDTAEPCNDFYQYACGNWNLNHPKPAYTATWNVFQEIKYNVKNRIKDILQESPNDDDTLSLKADKIKFRKCLHKASDDVGSLRSLIRSFGDWPLINSSWDSRGFGVWTSLTAIQEDLKLPLLVKTDVKLDVTRPGTLSHAIYVDQGELSLPTELLVQSKIDNKTLVSYHHLIETAAKELTNSSSNICFYGQIEDIIGFELKLGAIMAQQDGRFKDVARIPIDSSDISERYCKVHKDFVAYLNAVIVNSGQTLSQIDNIIFVEYGYVNKLLALIKSTEKQTLANYLIWRIVYAFLEQTNDVVRLAAHEFENTIYGYRESPPREVYCSSLDYGLGVTHKYLERHVNPKIKEQVEDYTKLIKKITELYITTSTLDAATKIEANLAISSIQECIYPDWLNDSQEVNKRYLLANSTPSEDLENIEFLDKLTIKYLYSNDSGEVEQNKADNVGQCNWKLTKFASITTPYYERISNTINFPISILQPPVFSIEFPDARNFGALGTIIGNKIGHSLHKAGWIKNKRFGNLTKIGKCLVDDYQKHSAANTRNAAPETVSQDFADILGVQMSYWAFKIANSINDSANTYMENNTDFSDDQLFFLSFAQTFCEINPTETSKLKNLKDEHYLSKYRVLGSLRNSPEFSQAFSCPIGSYMNPTSKCNIFNETQPKTYKNKNKYIPTDKLLPKESTSKFKKSYLWLAFFICISVAVFVDWVKNFRKKRERLNFERRRNNNCSTAV